MLQEVPVSPEVIIPTETTTLYDIATLINAVYQMTLEPTQAGYLPKRITKKLRPSLKAKQRYDYSDSEIYIDMLVQILRALKVISYTQPPFEDAKPYLAPGSAFKTWSSEDTTSQTRKLVNQWKSNHNWLDVNMFVDDVYNNGMIAIYGRQLLNYRQMLPTEISHCKPDHWYAMEDILKQIWEENPVQIAQITARTQFYDYSRKGRKDSYEEKYATWAKSAAPIFVNMFFSTLLELGLLEIGHENKPEERQVQFNTCMFRITELGASVLKEEPKSKSTSSAPVTPQKMLIVQPNYEILLMQPDLPTLYKLLPFTQVKQINLVSTLALTQASLIRGIKNGLRAEEVISLLTELSKKELPQNIVYTLQDWGKQYKQATITQAVILELPTEEVAQQMLQQATLAKMGIRQLAPCLLAIPQSFNSTINLASIRTALEKEGVMAQFIVPAGSKAASYDDDEYDYGYSSF
jgi:Helicase conserved C-terminal domain